MRTKLLMLLGVWVSSTMVVQAQTPSHLIVHQTDGSKTQADLQQTPRLEFEADNLVLKVNKQTATTLSYDKVARLTFEQALSSAIENMEIAGCQVVINNHILHVNAEQSICAVQVWNIQGQLVYSLSYGNHGVQLTIPAQWNAGVYIVGIETAATTTSHKIIIQ